MLANFFVVVANTEIWLVLPVSVVKSLILLYGYLQIIYFQKNPIYLKYPVMGINYLRTGFLPGGRL